MLYSQIVVGGIRSSERDGPQTTAPVVARLSARARSCKWPKALEAKDSNRLREILASY
jgi:hypothetical protein